MSLAITDFCFCLTYFPTFFTCEFYLPCDRELRQILAAYFAFASLTNLCVMGALRDDPNNGCEVDYKFDIEVTKFVKLKRWKVTYLYDLCTH